jgi:hypothetical protein
VSAATSTKDPTLRPYRAFTLGVYLVLVISFSSLVIWSVVRSVLAMTPKRVDSDQVLTGVECVEGAQKLFQELEHERRGALERGPARKVDARWFEFRTGWLQRLRTLEGQCALDSRDRRPLRDVFKRLQHVQDLYATHAVQYALEVGPSVDALQKAIAKARPGAATSRE